MAAEGEALQLNATLMTRSFMLLVLNSHVNKFNL